MRVLTSTLVILAAGLACVGDARAARVYVGGHGGYDFMLGNEDFDDAPTYGGTLGVDFDGPALELSVFHLSTDAADCATLTQDAEVDPGFASAVCRDVRQRFDARADLDITSIGLSGRYNFGRDPVRLYLLLGGEVHLTDLQTVANFPRPIGQRGTDDSETDFGLVGGGGIEVFLGEHVTVGPDVRYHVLFTDDFDSSDEISNTSFGDAPDFLSVVGRLNVYF